MLVQKVSREEHYLLPPSTKTPVLEAYVQCI
jgi:hypothetical protein